ncbi:MAG: STAS domain-containing protein [Nitrosomonadales bacterium]|nr:STAS domain-containing protein [Nitrosomonadales bacterium]
MAINVQTRESVATIAMSERFDFQVHREFKEAYVPLLANPAIREIEIDMSRLTYLDSSALGMLMLLRERALAENKSVRLSKPGKIVMQILEIANFGKLFQISQG